MDRIEPSPPAHRRPLLAGFGVAILLFLGMVIVRQVLGTPSVGDDARPLSLPYSPSTVEPEAETRPGSRASRSATIGDGEAGVDPTRARACADAPVAAQLEHLWQETLELVQAWSLDAASQPPEEYGLQGRVVSPDGASVPQAMVRLLERSEEGIEPCDAIPTSPDGRFAFEDVTAQDVVLMVRAGPAGAFRGEWARPQGERLDVGDIRLLSAAAVHGTVRDSAGCPETGIRVEVKATDSWNFESVSETGGLGRFRIDGIPPGEVCLIVDDRLLQLVDLAPGEERVLDVGGAPQVTGRFRGETDSGGLVAVVPAGWEANPLAAFGRNRDGCPPGLVLVPVDEHDRFAVSGLEPGAYYVGTPTAYRKLRLGREEVFVELQEHRIEGHVLAPSWQGDCAPEATVLALPREILGRVWDGDPEAVTRAIIAWMAGTSHGLFSHEYRLDVPDAGAYRVLPAAADTMSSWATEPVDVEVPAMTAGEVGVGRGDVLVVEAVSVSVDVAPRAAHLLLVATTGGVLCSLGVSEPGEGFDLALVPGTYRVRLLGSDGSRREQEFSVRPGAPVRLRLVDDAGGPEATDPAK